MLKCLMEAGIPFTKIKKQDESQDISLWNTRENRKRVGVHCLKTPLLLTMSCHLLFTMTNMLRSNGRICHFHRFPLIPTSFTRSTLCGMLPKAF